MAQPDKNLNILLVDDKANMRRTIRNMLRQVGYQNFVEADDGDTALIKLRSHKVDVILCDWNMPRLSGLGVLKVVREDDDLKYLPFIMVTAEMEQQTVAEAGEIQVDAYVLKPFTPALLQDKIIEVLNKKRTPSPIDTHLSLGEVYLKGRVFDKAETEFRKALKINPESPRTLHALGMLFEQKGNQPKAKELYSLAIKISPQFLKGHEALAQLYKSSGDLKNAAKHLQVAASISPKNVDRQIQLGESLLASGSKEEAKKAFSTALTLAKEEHTEVARKIGEAYLAADMAMEAQEVFQEAIAQDPRAIHLYNRLGIAYRRQGKFQEAITNYLTAIRIDPENENLFYNLGRAYFEAGDRDKSFQTMARALKLYPDFEEAKQFLTQTLKVHLPKV